MLRDLVDLLLPTACAGCDAPLISHGAERLCDSCLGAVPASLWPLAVEGLDAAWVWSSYDGPVGAALRRGKYRPDVPALQVLGRRLAAATAVPGADLSLVVPVPRSWQDLVRTGLEPAGLLAAPVAEALGLPLVRALRRRPGPAQASLPDAERAGNVLGAFRAVTDLSGARVLLVDDVITTGATARACAAALRGHGAASVVLLAACSPSV